MDALFAAIEALPAAASLRTARWGYALVNATHILGFALLIGAIVPLNLRLLGVWREVPLSTLSRVLTPVAAAGLLIAVTAGLLLFSVRAQDYAGSSLFQIKLVLVLAGTASALLFHWRAGLWLQRAGNAGSPVRAVVSILCWLGALLCGRLIAFSAIG